MHSPERFKAYAISIKGYQEPWWRTMIGGLLIVLFMYLSVGIASIFQAVEGADIAYVSFWHAPWKLLFNL